jgi:predicted O-methyltransferase YrrM
MDILNPQVTEYLTNLIPPRHPEMQKMEAYAEKNNFPIIGPICGHMCYRIARGSSARRVFELGSGYGYSTAWFARGVSENGGGEVHHVVWDEKLSEMAHQHLDKMGYQDIVRYTVGEAIQALSAAPGSFDLIFMDIDKQDYPKALPIIETKLKAGGTLLVDNMLWSGRIFDEKDTSPETQAIRELTGMVMNNDRWVGSVIPIRDGLLIANKLN